MNIIFFPGCYHKYTDKMNGNNSRAHVYKHDLLKNSIIPISISIVSKWVVSQHSSRLARKVIQCTFKVVREKLLCTGFLMRKNCVLNQLCITPESVLDLATCITMRNH